MAVILIASLYSLWSLKILSTLDFMALPGMMYFIIDRYIPMLGITIAFKKVDYSLGVWDSPWVGLENFKMLFHTGEVFLTAMRLSSRAIRFCITRYLFFLVFLWACSSASVCRTFTKRRSRDFSRQVFYCRSLFPWSSWRILFLRSLEMKLV